MTKLLSLAVYLFYIVCLVGLSILVLATMSNSPSVMNLPNFIKLPIFFVMPLAPKSVLLMSESYYTLPSGVSQVIAILPSVACYLVCPIIMPVLVGTSALVLWGAALWQDHHTKQLPYWIFMIIFWVTFVVSDRVTSNYTDPALISEFLYTSLKFLPHIIYIPCKVALSYLVFHIAHSAIRNTRSWWSELIRTSIVGLTLRLLNMMWGSPFQKPYSDSDMFGVAAYYLIYIVYSMAVSSHYLDSSSKTFVISLTFVLLDVFVKPASVSDMIPALGTIATALLAFFFLMAISFGVFMFLHKWADILLPSTSPNYPAATFVIIAGLTFMVMQTMLGMPVEEPSIFSDMKAGLLGITSMINKYQGAYLVIKTLTVLVIPLLSRESRPILMYTTAAFIVAISILPSGQGTPTEYPASTLVTDDFVQKTIKSFITSQISGVDGETEQLTDS